MTRSTWAGNKVAMWRTADPHTRVQIPLRPLIFLLFFVIIFSFKCLADILINEVMNDLENNDNY